MKTLKRFNTKYCDFFITVVTCKRIPVLLRHPELFWESWSSQKLTAWVIMPDHFHAILNPGDNDISDIVHGFKITYSRRYRDLCGPGRVWQNRFWDHMIRNDEDYQRHLDYIHFNPVKHGMTTSPFEHEHSSLQEFFRAGIYAADWGGMNTDIEEMEFGE